MRIVRTGSLLFSPFQAFAVAAALLAGCDAALAQSKLTARYAISMTGVPIGKGLWTVVLGSSAYEASASGAANGVMSVLVSGEGTLAARGLVENGRLSARSFIARLTKDGDKSELTMTLDDTGKVKDLVVTEPDPDPDRVPLTAQHRVGVTDPLTALLVPHGEGGPPGPEICNRVLRIFDGQHRFDLALAFKRQDKIRIEKSDERPVAVCGVVLQPIAGHRHGSTLVKYVSGRKDMEIWFAPIAGTGIAAPVRISVPTLLGTMLIQATQFDVVAQTAGG